MARILTKGASLPTAWKRVSLSEAATNSDPNNRLSTPLTDGGNGVGIQASITGGWSDTDPFNAAYLTFPILRPDGSTIPATDVWSISLLLVERTAPGLSSDTIIWAGICNEATDSGTVDAIMGRIGYTAASKTSGWNTVANGVAGTATIATTGTVARLHLCIARLGTIGAYCQVENRFALTSGNVNIASTLNPTTIPSGGDNTPYLLLAFGRSAATAGTETCAYDLYYIPPTSVSGYPA